jgi:hypothetical protein
MTRRDELERLRESASTAFGEAVQDAMIYGTGITQNGKRIDPRDYYLAPQEPTQEGEG